MKLNRVLFQQGLVGEGLADKQVHLVKSHFPERYGKAKFFAERAVLLVRNPVDCLASLFHMICSGSHNASIADSDFIKFKSEWSQFLQQDISVWKDFHDFWLNSTVPLHIVRYEDLVSDPSSTLENLFKFLLNTKEIEGTVVQKMIALAVADASPPEIYKPRQAKINGSFDKFDSSQLQFLYNYTEQLLQMFSYTDAFKSHGLDSASLAKPGASWSGKHLGNATIEISPDFLGKFNGLQLSKSIDLFLHSDEIRAIMVNCPQTLLRKKCQEYPEGRTTKALRAFLRPKVSITPKSKSDALEQEPSDNGDY
mmetsp:Transcript_1893/g.3289  ORF Transcript_1893/g.3289 Transcript_1893/m.3289 type:complete len:310 (-) Transcript_1893:29-958(-)